jgi:hypothetical protein
MHITCLRDAAHHMLWARGLSQAVADPRADRLFGLPDDNVVDGNVKKLDSVADRPHHNKADEDRVTGASKLCKILLYEL